ncbi:unannotated protein [freshwater metagenome]|uniref:Unannotated protein n=1 Tax=freshwater metagenome TaxID=449393 RepID=A0A6J7PRQ3_9ZZZZ
MVLGIVDIDDPVAVVVEDSGVEQLVLRFLTGALSVGAPQVVVGEFALRVVVAAAEPGVRRGGVTVPPVLLHILAVITLVAAKPEEPLFEVRVAAIPECESDAHVLEQRRQAREAVLVPAVGPRNRMVVGKGAPGVTIVGVVLTDRAPSALGQVGTPLVPRPGIARAMKKSARVFHAPLLAHDEIMPWGHAPAMGYQ